MKSLLKSQIRITLKRSILFANNKTKHFSRNPPIIFTEFSELAYFYRNRKNVLSEINSQYLPIFSLTTRKFFFIEIDF